MAVEAMEASPALASRLASGRGTARLSAGFGEPIPMEAVRAVWEKLVAGNPLLHSGFRVQTGGRIVQLPGPAAQAAWEELDWSGLPREELALRWNQLSTQEVDWGDGWENLPLVRATGIRLPGGVPHLLVTYPGFLLTEEDWFFLLCELVEGLEGRVPAPPADPQPELGLQPSADPAWWDSLKAAGPSARIVNPLHPAVSGQPGWQSTLLDRDTTRALVEACRRTDVEPPTALLGLWSLLVARKTGRQEVLLLASPPGSVDNPLPCRFRSVKDAALASILRAFNEDERIRSAAAGTSLATMEWEPGRPVRNDDFAGLFEFLPPALNDRIPDAYPRWINLDARILQEPAHGLVLEVRDGDRLGLRLHAAGLSQRAGEALLSEVESVVRLFTAKPSAHPSACWSDDAMEIPARRPEPPVSPAPVQDTIAEVAARLPDAVAVDCAGGETLTFRDLDSHAGRLAGHFSRENLTGGWTVGVCLTPSPWVPVAMLAILRAGNTCLPLEPGCAPGWIGSQLDGADCELVICDTSTESLFAGSQRRTLVIDREWETIGAGDPLSDEPEPAAVAVLLAGTERTPPPPIRSFSPTFLAGCCSRSARRTRMAEGDRVVVADPAGSAGFLEGVFGGLAAGATVVFAGTDADGMEPALEATHVRMTAEAFRARVAGILRSGGFQCPGSLRSVAVDLGGGFLPSSVVAGWLDASGGLPVLAFLSPCGFLGVGLQNEVVSADLSLPTVAAGQPTASSGCSFLDPVGLRPAPGYPGRLDFHPTHGEPVSVGWPAWRDASGHFHIILPPESGEVISAFSREGILDVATDPERPGPKWAVVRDGITVPIGIVSVPEIPIRHGRQDVRSLPSPQAPRRPSVAPASGSGGASAPVPQAAAVAPVAPPTAVLRSLGGNPDAPLLIIVDPEGRDTHAISSVLEPDWSLASIDCPSHIPDPAREAMRWLAALPDGVPLHFLGLGAAGMVAYEITRLLRASGRDVPYLAIAGTLPPEAPKRSGWLGALVRGRSARPGPGYHPEPLEGPCGIIFTIDMPVGAWDRWGHLAPDALTQETRRSLSELLGPDPEELAGLLAAFSGEG